MTKQEFVLDKIRAEIKDWQTDIHDNENDAGTHDFVFERIYEIFDEYDTESAHRKPLESLIGTEILKAKQNITVGKEDYNMGIYVGLIKALNLFEDKEREE